MIRLDAKINLLVSNYGLILGATSNVSGNNVSADISEMVGLKEEGADAFIIGASRVGDDVTYYDDVDYYIGSQLSDERGSFASPYIITLTGSSIKAFSIAFDTTNNRHPISIVVDGKTYYDDDPIFSVFNVEQSQTHTVEIYNWNEANYPLVVTGIYADLEVDVEARNIVYAKSTISDRESLNAPEWGIVCNTGQLKFNDNNGLQHYIEQQLLKSGSQVEFVMKNTLTGKSEKKGSYVVQKWEYDNGERFIKAIVKDDLVEWQTIEVEGFPFNANAVGKSAQEYYEYLHAKTIENGNFEMLSFEQLDETTKDVIQKTKINTPILYTDSLWAQWSKLCRLCLLHIFKGEDGIVVCKYNGGN